MSKFSFPELCSFCHSRLGSINCLLPHELIVMYTHLDDDLENSIMLSEIHINYGTERLLSNYNFVQWFIGHPKSQTSSQKRRIDDIMKCLPGFPREQLQMSGDFTVTEADALSFNQQESIALSQHANRRTSVWIRSDHFDEAPIQETITKVPTHLNQRDEPTSTHTDENSELSFTSSENNDVDDLDTDTKVSNDAETPITIVDSTSVSPTTVTVMSEPEDSVYHATRFIALGAILLNQMESKGITKTKTRLLMQSLEFEIALKFRNGIKYKPTPNAELNHPIALAKALVAAHENHDLTSWKSGLLVRCSHFCLLNFSAFFTNSQHTAVTSLFDSMLQFCKTGIHMLSKHTEKSVVEQLILQELNTVGKPQLLTWLYSTQLSDTSLNYHKDLAFIGFENVNFILDLDDRSKLLQSFIVKANCARSSPFVEVNEATQLMWKLIKLSAYHIDNNKSWRNPTSILSMSAFINLMINADCMIQVKDRYACHELLKAAILLYSKRVPPN